MSDIEKIIWKTDFSVGNEKIDDEHKKLIKIYNELVDLISFGSDRVEFARILSEMTDYSLIHFKQEEKYMQEFDYPRIAEHKQFHRKYIYQVAKYNTDLLSIRPPDPSDVIKYLKKWWINHILDSDLDYEKYRSKTQAKA